MHIIQIPEKNITKYLPEDLSECDTRQYIEMSSLILIYQSGELTYEEFRIHAIYKLLDMKAINPGVEDQLKYSMVYQLSELVDSFFEINEQKERVIKQYYIHNHIPKIRAVFRNFYGPEGDFKSTFGEYIDALDAFVNFNQTGEVIYLQQMLAIYYRKRNPFTKKDIHTIPIPLKKELICSNFRIAEYSTVFICISHHTKNT